MNEDKSMNKRQWTYEDAVDYVLKNMKRKLRKQFEEDLKWDKELRELYELALSRKEMFKKLDNYKVPAWKIKSGYEKVLNTLRVDIKPEVGQIWQLKTNNFSLLEKKLFEDLYVLILNTIDLSEIKHIDHEEFLSDKELSENINLETSEKENSLLQSKTCKSEYDQQSRTSKTGISTSYRVVLLSKKPEYALNHDLIFTEPLISFAENNVVAHMHLTGNILQSHLAYYVGNVNDKIFKAIRQADHKDYSLINIKDIKRKENDPEVDLEKIEIWTDVVRNVLNRLSDETLDTIEEVLIDHSIYNYIEEPIELNDSNNILYSKDRFAIPSQKKFEVEKKYLIDENSNIIIIKNKSQLPNKIRDLITETSRVPEINNSKSVSAEEIQKLIYFDASEEQLVKLIKSLVSERFHLLEIDSITSRETRYAARVSRKHLSSNYIELFSDSKIIVSFCILEIDSSPELFVEIVFLQEQNLKKIDLFLFSVKDQFEGYFSKNIRVIGGVALIPLYRSPEKIIKNYNEYLIGFKYKMYEIKLILKLIIQ